MWWALQLLNNTQDSVIKLELYCPYGRPTMCAVCLQRERKWCRKGMIGVLDPKSKWWTDKCAGWDDCWGPILPMSHAPRSPLPLNILCSRISPLTSHVLRILLSSDIPHSIFNQDGRCWFFSLYSPNFAQWVTQRDTDWSGILMAQRIPSEEILSAKIGWHLLCHYNLRDLPRAHGVQGRT